jgi:hypothetical protein
MIGGQKFLVGLAHARSPSPARASPAATSGGTKPPATTDNTARCSGSDARVLNEVVAEGSDVVAGEFQDPLAVRDALLEEIDNP